MFFSYMTTYFVDDFARYWKLVAFSKVLRLIGLEILKYLEYRYPNSKKLKLSVRR